MVALPFYAIDSGRLGGVLINAGLSPAEVETYRETFKVPPGEPLVLKQPKTTVPVIRISAARMLLFNFIIIGLFRLLLSGWDNR